MRRRRADARDPRRRGPDPLASPAARGPGGERGRPHAAPAAARASSRSHRCGVRRGFHERQARDIRVLVLNAGSSSLKLSLIDSDDRVLVDREFEVAEGRLDESQLATTLHAMEGVEAIGHRVVHGGPRYRTSVRLDPEVVRYLVTISDLAPLHLPAALSGISATRELLPRVPGVACLDTAFHARMPEA